ncbi:unnamed protein product [Zymoseptoria tritici ST99CH_1A5]|uniref:NACHT-NTPase and P-loop NTPases N-terminal domain-containing protein n=2 Tax=Zymoseptoria tritici TaxID=1047171 RepID=A0A2H1GPZ8_ZYMTR|nr:unnamed protein product [Zymoseptoria tritici ST99CH_1E4]SMY26466.1 unnamed protein product [Zymoseptoria tritici ST99CH_1A5]
MAEVLAVLGGILAVSQTVELVGKVCRKIKNAFSSNNQDNSQSIVHYTTPMQPTPSPTSHYPAMQRFLRLAEEAEHKYGDIAHQIQWLHARIQGSGMAQIPNEMENDRRLQSRVQGVVNDLCDLLQELMGANINRHFEFENYSLRLIDVIRNLAHQQERITFRFCVMANDLSTMNSFMISNQITAVAAGGSPSAYPILGMANLALAAPPTAPGPSAPTTTSAASPGTAMPAQAGPPVRPGSPTGLANHPIQLLPAPPPRLVTRRSWAPSIQSTSNSIHYTPTIPRADSRYLPMAGSRIGSSSSRNTGDGRSMGRRFVEHFGRNF